MPRQPKILHCVSHLDLGGAEAVALSIAEGLREHHRFGFHAVRGTAPTAFGRTLETRIQKAGFARTQGPRVPMRWGGLIIGAWSLARAVRRQQPDLLHLHTEIPESSLAFGRVMFPSLRAQRAVRTIHNSKIWHFAPGLGAFCERRLRDAPCAAVSLAALEALRSSKARARLAVEADAAVILYNGVLPPPSKPLRTSAPDGPWRLVFGGRFEDEKGFDLLPAILGACALPPGQAARLDLFGKGVLEPVAKALAAHPPQGWTVAWHPPVPELAAQLHHYDVALVPSRFEGLSLFAIEALLAGCTVISSEARGLDEVLPSTYPLRAPVGDARAFAKVLEGHLHAPGAHLEACERVRAAAVERFSVETMLEGYRSLYARALLGSAKGRGP